MKKSDLYEIATKLLGMYVLTFSFMPLANLIFDIHGMLHSAPDIAMDPYADSGITSAYLALNFLYVGVLVFFAALLIFGNKMIINAICRKSDFEEEISFKIEGHTSLLESLITIAGLVLVAFSLPELFFKLYHYFIPHTQNFELPTHEAFFFYITAVEIIFGIFIILLAPSLARLILRRKNVKV